MYKYLPLKTVKTLVIGILKSGFWRFKCSFKVVIVCTFFLFDDIVK